MNIFWGDKIGLRPFEETLTEEEIARVHRWSSDENILRWSGGAPTDLTLPEFRERLLGERGYVPDHRRAFFIITRDGELIGRIGIFAIDWDTHEGELGIVIGESAIWGQGYGRDAIQTLLRHVFATTPLERIHLYTFPENVRAQRCFVAAGFRTIGNARRFSPDIGEFDGIEMEITRREFLEAKRWTNLEICPTFAKEAKWANETY
ncbi:MAG: GNAT family N-acetyltransferase [Chloroflexota bacterium]|nr:GNAT family N-acetyltransferase [Chloroflexota bacterium]